MKKNLFTTLLLLSLYFLFQSCKKESNIILENDSINKVEKIKTDTLKNLKSDLRPNENLELGKIYFDTVQYIDFNDDGDYWLFIVQKNKDSIYLISEQTSEFIRGDELEIQWKIDSIRPAGDPEYLDFREHLISVKKLKSLKIPDKTVKILWRETVFDDELNTDINALVLNENYIKTISEPEKAVLAYVATFIGNECSWDGEADENRTNLKCKILSALDLGYQCSPKHLGFLKNWFRSNKLILKELEACPIIPDGATVQDTFDEMNLSVKENRIIISIKANGINMREGKSWEWNEKQEFTFKNNELFLIKKEKSEIKPSDFEVRGN